jgi:hypothetical protein
MTAPGCPIWLGWLVAAVFAAGCGGPSASGGLPMSPTASPSPAPTPTVSPTAAYRVTFDARWSAATHPTDIPSNPHFSTLIGGTHDARVLFWAAGRPASEGIRRMAELGSQSPLDEEVSQAIAQGTAGAVVRGGGVGLSPGSATAEFTGTIAHPLVTLVTMVAPSPDWFVGVSALSLLRDGQWVSELAVDLLPHDAGTDDGTTFLSPDLETTPRAPVALITGYPFGNNGPMAPLGTFTFRRIDR